MARPAKFTADDILDGTAHAVAAHGPSVTIGQISARIGVPVGSIYHRFPSREHLMTTLWLRSIRQFHQGLLATREIRDPREALLAQAVHQPRFCRAHPEVALAMSLYSQRQLMATGPEGLRDEVGRVNDDIWTLGRQRAQALYGAVAGRRAAEVVQLAVRQTPYGMIRTYIRGQQKIPRWIDQAVLAAAGAILDMAVAGGGGSRSGGAVAGG